MTGGKARVVSAVPALWITGLGTQYPAYLLGPERLDEFAARFHDIEVPRFDTPSEQRKMNY